MTSLFPCRRAVRKAALSGVAAVLLLAACSSNPDSYQPLTELRAEVQELRQSALPALIPTSFAEVELALSRAEGALGEVGAEEIRHLTTLAEIRLATARVEGEAAAARREREQLLEERRTILGRARQRELGASRPGDEAAAQPPDPAQPGGDGSPQPR